MREFVRILNNLNIQFEVDFSLATASSFRVGGRADIAIFPKNEAEFVNAISNSSYSLSIEAKNNNIRFEVIGNASNVLFSDDGYRGAIIFTKSLCEISYIDNSINAFCGVKLPVLSKLAYNNSISGLEFAHGIPGSVGGAVAMNAGAYGGAISDVLEFSRAFDINTGKIYTLSKDEHLFDYRKSIYTENKNLICIDAVFRLNKGNATDINKKMQDNLQSRKDKQPIDLPSCGSFFKRPEGYFAAKLIDDCNLKGVSVAKFVNMLRHR